METRPVTQQQQAVSAGASKKATRSRAYSTWARAEEDEFHLMATNRADLPQKAFVEAVCQLVPAKDRSQVSDIAT